jgi:hypothetical protein
MAIAPATAERPEAPLFADGLGERVVAIDAPTGDLLQILRVRPQLLAVPSFEFALRERAARLANFRHAYYARVRRIDRHPGGLAIVSDHVEGVRLSEMLRVAHARGLTLELNAALCLLRQLVPSLALLHENARDVAHAIVGPERLIVTPRARLVVVEHVLGSAVEQLQFSRERLWQELRVAVPASAGPTRFDHRADVTAIGLTALALVLGRPLTDDEYPHRATALLGDARARGADGESQPLPDSLHTWIARALQLDGRQGFTSATDAQIALEDALAEDTGFIAAPVALETFLSRYISAILEPSTPVAQAPKPAAAPVAPVEPVPAPRPLANANVAPIVVAAPLPQVIVAPPAVAPAAIAPPVAMPRAAASSAAAPIASATIVPVAPVAPVTVAPPVAPPPPVAAAPAPASDVELYTPAPVAPSVALPSSPAPSPAVPPRDITDLLRDLDLPGAPASAQATERQTESSTPVRRGGGSGNWRWIAAAALGLVVLVGGGIAATRVYRKPAAPLLGTLSVQTNPAGVPVFIDGVAHGSTPARISLSSGSHILELRGHGVPRVIPVTITSGAEASQYLELTEAPSTGSLLVQSDPAGARVTIDGTDHGPAPVSVTDLAPGEHELLLQAEGATPVRQKVTIQAGVTASILAPVATASAGPVSGWITVKAPVTIELREGGRLVGTSDADKIMMAAGRHDVELANQTLGYHSTRTIQVPPGKVTAIAVDLPQGTINVNASPWAEVFIDGRRVGETPIGNLSLPIGPHEVLFRHPQLGEKRQAVSVTLNAPARLVVDMK